MTTIETQVQEATGLTRTRARLLTAYLQDAPNWSGTPWLRDSNVGWSKNQLRTVRELEAAGYLIVTGTRPEEVVTFTEAVRPLLPIVGVEPETVGLLPAETAAPRASRATIPAMGMEDEGPCIDCGLTLEPTKFPTAIRQGEKVRLTECRACRDRRYDATR